MKDTCRVFSAIHRHVPKDIKELVLAPCDERLALAAATFIALQEARHLSDYDLLSDFSLNEGGRIAVRASGVLEIWDALCVLPATAVFLAMLLLGNKLYRRG